MPGQLRLVKEPPRVFYKVGCQFCAKILHTQHYHDPPGTVIPLCECRESRAWRRRFRSGGVGRLIDAFFWGGLIGWAIFSGTYLLAKGIS